MANLLIRDLDDDVKSRLRVQAAQHGTSMEAEARAILATALSGHRPARALGSHIEAQFAKVGGIDIEVAPRTDPARSAARDA